MSAYRHRKYGAAARKRRAILFAVASAGAAALLLAVVLLVRAVGWRAVYERLDVDYSGTASQLANDEVSVSFLDVGQGDCSVIIAGDSVVMIDAGDWDAGDGIVAWLRERGIKKIDYLVCTHPHTDHIGGMLDVLQALSVRNFVAGELPDELVPTNSTYIELLSTLQRLGTGYIDARSDGVIALDRGELQLLCGGEVFDDLNACSLVIRYVYGERAFLFMGDAERQTEQFLLDRGVQLNCDVIKVGHHGSRYAGSKQFYRATRAAYAVISCSADNSYGYPHQQTLELLKSCKIKYFITAQNGTVTFVSDGEGLSAAAQRE